MSKYDNLFKTAYNSEKSLKSNIFLSKDTNENNQKDTKFNYKEELFPDLSVNKVLTSIPVRNSTNTNNNSKNYAIATATVNESKKVNKNPVMPGWVQYTKSKSNKNTTIFDVTYGDKTKRQIEQEEKQKEEYSLYIHNKIVTTLANNWNKYKQQYDELHGEGAYDLAHYTEPIYPSLDEHFSDDEKESNTYSSEEEYYSYDKY